jgi:hypothetical protein
MNNDAALTSWCLHQELHPYWDRTGAGYIPALPVGTAYDAAGVGIEGLIAELPSVGDSCFAPRVAVVVGPAVSGTCEFFCCESFDSHSSASRNVIVDNRKRINAPTFSPYAGPDLDLYLRFRSSLMSPAGTFASIATRNHGRVSCTTLAIKSIIEKRLDIPLL